MSHKNVFLYSGQGSQYFHMGKELYQNNAGFRYWMDHCAEIAQAYTGTSIIDVLYNSGSRLEPFDRLLYSNPAIVAIEYSLTRMLQAEGVEPDYLMGYSLGEFTAAIVSGAISLNDGIQTVCKIALLAEAHCETIDMLVVLTDIGITERFPAEFSGCVITGRNFPGSFVVSGRTGPLQKLKMFLDQQRILTQTLPVHYGFHTSSIDCIKDPLLVQMAHLRFTRPLVSVVSALTPNFLTNFDADYLWRVIREPILFDQSVRWLDAQGPCMFIDVGPSGSLATFVKYILPATSGSGFLPTLTPYGKDLVAMDKMFKQLSGGLPVVAALA